MNKVIKSKTLWIPGTFRVEEKIFECISPPRTCIVWNLEILKYFLQNTLQKKVPRCAAGKIAKKVTLEEGVSVESAFNMWCHIVKNTLLHIAFSEILPAG